MNPWSLWIGVAFILLGFWYSLAEGQKDAGWLFCYIGLSIWWVTVVIVPAFKSAT